MLLIRLWRNCFALIGESFAFEFIETDPKCPEACAYEASSDFSPGESLNDARTRMVRLRNSSSFKSVTEWAWSC